MQRSASLHICLILLYAVDSKCFPVDLQQAQSSFSPDVFTTQIWTVTLGLSLGGSLVATYSWQLRLNSDQKLNYCTVLPASAVRGLHSSHSAPPPVVVFDSGCCWLGNGGCLLVYIWVGSLVATYSWQLRVNSDQKLKYCTIMAALAIDSNCFKLNLQQAQSSFSLDVFTTQI